MKRGVAIVVAGLAAMAATAALAASAHNYSGNVRGSGKIQLRIKRAHGVRKVTRFDFQHVGLTCNGHHRRTTGNLDFTTRIRHGEFKIRGKNQRGGKIRARGHLEHHARTVKGTISFDGTIHVDGDGFAHHCHSGHHHWRAHRL
jgi:hypothetical protein